jgi:hypothetical protein
MTIDPNDQTDDATGADDVHIPSKRFQRVRSAYRLRAGEHSAPTDYVHFKLRIRQQLVKRLQEEAAKKKHSANHEAVQRLEESFSRDERSSRDSEILKMLLGFSAKNDNQMELFKYILSELRELGRGDIKRITKHFSDLIRPYREKQIEAQRLEASDENTMAAEQTTSPEGDSE